MFVQVFKLLSVLIFKPIIPNSLVFPLRLPGVYRHIQDLFILKTVCAIAPLVIDISPIRKSACLRNMYIDIISVYEYAIIAHCGALYICICVLFFCAKQLDRRHSSSSNVYILYILLVHHNMPVCISPVAAVLYRVVYIRRVTSIDCLCMMSRVQ